MWSEVEAQQGKDDWSGYDPAIKGLHLHGIEPVLTLVSTPGWANGGRGANWVPASGATFAAALKVAREAGPGSVTLAMLPDTGERYLSTALFEGISDGGDPEP